MLGYQILEDAEQYQLPHTWRSWVLFFESEVGEQPLQLEGRGLTVSSSLLPCNPEDVLGSFFEQSFYFQSSVFALQSFLISKPSSLGKKIMGPSSNRVCHSGKHGAKGSCADPHFTLQKWLPTRYHTRGCLWVPPLPPYIGSIPITSIRWKNLGNLLLEVPHHCALRALIAFNLPPCLRMIFIPSYLLQRKEEYN